MFVSNESSVNAKQCGAVKGARNTDLDLRKAECNTNELALHIVTRVLQLPKTSGLAPYRLGQERVPWT